MISSLTDELFLSKELCQLVYRNIDPKLIFCLKREVQSFLKKLLPPSISPHGKFTEPSRGIIFQRLGFVSRDEYTTVQSCLRNVTPLLRFCQQRTLQNRLEECYSVDQFCTKRILQSRLEECYFVALYLQNLLEKSYPVAQLSLKNFKSCPEECYSVLWPLSFRTERRVLFCVRRLFLKVRIFFIQKMFKILYRNVTPQLSFCLTDTVHGYSSLCSLVFLLIFLYGGLLLRS